VIRFPCAVCHELIEVHESLISTVVACPHCRNHVLVVPPARRLPAVARAFWIVALILAVLGALFAALPVLGMVFGSSSLPDRHLLSIAGVLVIVLAGHVVAVAVERLAGGP